MEEKNFIDIRRNFIIASVILILFLLYGANIQVEQLLIFKFNVSGDWAIISPYYDIGIILTIFFLYTLARYYIYGIEEINQSHYNRIFLLEFLRKICNENPVTLKSKIASLSQKPNKKDPEVNLDIKECSDIFMSLDKLDDNLYLGFFANNSQRVRLLGERYVIPDNGKDIYISNNGFSFSNVEILFNDKDIWKEYGPGFIKLIFRKEFSDFWWPLGLIILVILLFIFRIFDYFFCF